MRSYLLASSLVFTAYSSLAQWCVPTSAVPYAASMPGVTMFTCNTISRPSADIENYPNNSYVLTGLTTTLQRGATYPVTVGFTLDQPISPHMNLRIWIDLNHDEQLDDPGETLLSVDHLAGPTHTGTITIPMTAMTGSTRMRVTAKMCSHGGHSLPTPCDFPADPIGYHGEIEDYTAVIVDAVGVEEQALGVRFAVVPQGASAEVLLSLDAAAEIWMEVMDATGRVLSTTAPAMMTQGEHRSSITLPQQQGAYVVRLWVNGSPYSQRFFN